MAVSLKKRAKVDLSKPELPQKVREYTPVHLMDEEETIKKPVTETETFPTCSSEPVMQADDVTEPVRQVNVEVDTDFVRFRFSRGLIVAFSVLGSLGLCLFLVSLLFTLPDLLSAMLPSDAVVGDIGSIMRTVSTHPMVILSMVLGCVGLSVRFIRKFLDVGRF